MHKRKLQYTTLHLLLLLLERTHREQTADPKSGVEVAATQAAPCGAPQAYVQPVLDLHEHRWKMIRPLASPNKIYLKRTRDMKYQESAKKGRRNMYVQIKHDDDKKMSLKSKEIKNKTQR